MRWLDAFGRWLSYDPAERQALRDRDVTPIDGGVPQELERLNDSDDDDLDLRSDDCGGWPGSVAEGETPWDDASTERLRQALAEDTKRLQSRGITEGTQT